MDFPLWREAMRTGRLEDARALFRPTAWRELDEITQQQMVAEIMRLRSIPGLDGLIEIGFDVRQADWCLMWLYGPMEGLPRYPQENEGTSSSAMLQALLDRGMSVHGSYEYTPLHLACFRGRLDLVTLLLDHGADPDARDHLNRLPDDEFCMGLNPNTGTPILTEDTIRRIREEVNQARHGRGGCGLK